MLSGKGKGLVIAGTDTGVGKTIVCGGLAAALNREGVNVGVMKPVESGCRVEGGEPVADDATFLRRMARCKDAIGLVNPYSFEAAVAPALAAKMEGVDVRMEVVKEAFHQLAIRHEVVLIEGAGGMLSPLAENWSLPQLARELGAPMLIVSRNTLGAINQCLLALNCARHTDIPVLGLVLNHTAPEAGRAEELNPGALRKWAGVPVLGSVPYMATVDPARVAKAVRGSVDTEPIMKWLRS